MTSRETHKSSTDLSAPGSSWRHLSLMLLILYWLALAVGTHIPRLPHVVSANLIDKVCHFVGFFGLGFLTSIAWSMRRPADRPLNWSNFALLWLLLGIYGAIDETTQPWVGRSCELADWLADLGGLAAAMACFAATKSFMQSLASALSAPGKNATT